MTATAARMDREAGNSRVTKPRLNLLLVEDDEADRELILRELTKGGF